MIKHQVILNRIEETFQTILIAGGFNTDLGERVYVNKANKIISAADENAMNIVDVSLSVVNALTGGVINYFTYLMAIETTLHFKGGTAATDIREGLWDVIKAIGLDLTWGGNAINTYPPEGGDFIQMLFEQEENIIVGAKVFFIIEFRTQQWESFEDVNEES